MLILSAAPVLLLPACTRTETVTPTLYATTTSTVTVTAIISFAPSLQEVQAAGSASPEIPRIRAEALKMMVDEAKAAGANKSPDAYKGPFIKAWDNFVIIDTTPSTRFDLAWQPLERNSNIPGSINIPFTFYSVADPAKDLKPAELAAYNQEMKYLTEHLYQLPKDKPIIIYDAADNDEAACLMARMLLEHGYNPQLVSVLWKGFNYWYHELQYLASSESWTYQGG